MTSKEEGLQIVKFLKKITKTCNENSTPRNQAPTVLNHYIDTTQDCFYALRELKGPHPECVWPKLINGLFTAIFQFRSVTVADLAGRYDSLWSLRQDPNQTDQAFVQRVINETETFQFVSKEHNNPIRRRLIGGMLENVPALLGTSRANLMGMPREELLAELSKRHPSESSMASRVLAQVKGSPTMMAAVVQEKLTVPSYTSHTGSTGVPCARMCTRRHHREFRIMRSRSQEPW